MATYLLDYENVHADGLEGIRTLSGDDHVIIFYSDQVKSIPFERHVEMMNSRARIEFIETHKTGKNYLDFQLTTQLGYLIGKGETDTVYIISKDQGFDSVVDFWKGRNIKIARQECIQPGTESKPVKKTKKSGVQKTAGLSESYRKKVRTAVKEDGVSAGTYSTIYKAIINSKSKQEFHNSIMKVLGNEKSTLVYNHLKDVYQEYSETNKNPAANVQAPEGKQTAGI
ncbi:MAG: hypothetical protein J6A08_10960 [Lachnospiraceae bacterium]|nr:hypothetical protein [Lachnospiraceae bacterium]